MKTKVYETNGVISFRDENSKGFDVPKVIPVGLDDEDLAVHNAGFQKMLSDMGIDGGKVREFDGDSVVSQFITAAVVGKAIATNVGTNLKHHNAKNAKKK
jgi:hypothetical protein